MGGRTGETFVSESEQEERIRDVCARDDLELVQVLIEENVSGGASLERRSGLRPAVELVEAGDADVVVVAYFDRLVRSLAVQAEVVERVERAGGAILALDVGEVRADTASHWLSATMLGAVAEYHRRVTAERTAAAKARAVDRGVPPFPNIPPGYRRDAAGRIEPDPATREAVAAAFQLRAEGATIKEVREHLARHDIVRSWHGVQAMLASRVYLGELRFGKLIHEDADRAIVSPDVWSAVQRTRSTRGRRAKSERLLARLGVLRCGTCGGRMVVGTAHNGEYALYRCSPVGDCERRVTISAEIAEREVLDALREILRGMRGTAAVEQQADAAERELAAIEDSLDRAVEAFSDLDDVASARDKLTALRERRDAARERVAELRASVSPSVTFSVDDLHLASHSQQRALIRAAIERVDVLPGRGADRLVIRSRL